MWTVLERGLPLDRLKRARRCDPRRKDGAASGFDSENWNIVTKHTSPKCRPVLILLLKETSSNLHFENKMLHATHALGLARCGTMPWLVCARVVCGGQLDTRLGVT